jgi:transposase
VKNDERDAIDLADMLRLGRLPEAWIAPPAVRERRELVRYRAKLVALRSGLKAQVHAVMAKEGVLPAAADLFCMAGNAQLDGLAMADSYTTGVESLRDLIELYDREVGLTPRHRESDIKTTRGSITKQGSKLVRWALIEAVSRYHGGPKLAGDFRRIAERRGTNKARVAVARKVLTLVYHGLRDGEIRCLAPAQAA